MRAANYTRMARQMHDRLMVEQALMTGTSGGCAFSLLHCSLNPSAPLLVCLIMHEL